MSNKDTIIKLLVEQSLAKTAKLVEVQRDVNAVHERCEDLMKQNDMLSDRNHLDLDPRIARMIDTGARNHAQYCEALAEQTQTINELRVRLSSYRDQADEVEQLSRKLELVCGAKARLQVDNDEMIEKLDNIHEECIR